MLTPILDVSDVKDRETTKKGRLPSEGSDKNLDSKEVRPKVRPRMKKTNREDGSDDGTDQRKEKGPRKEKARAIDSEDVKMDGQGDLKGTSHEVKRLSKRQRNVDNTSVSSLPEHHTYGETYLCAQGSESKNSIIGTPPPRKKG